MRVRPPCPNCGAMLLHSAARWCDSAVRGLLACDRLPTPRRPRAIVRRADAERPCSFADHQAFGDTVAGRRPDVRRRSHPHDHRCGRWRAREARFRLPVHCSVTDPGPAGSLRGDPALTRWRLRPRRRHAGTRRTRVGGRVRESRSTLRPRAPSAPCHASSSAAALDRPVPNPPPWPR